ncbi:pyridoxal kinase [Pleomorphomonas sp. PLEO]|uniref:pyridoxal kinase n=1 Tax=Pleomorphomonas sp. PLEO TaxID=3239306 RepID=UPI00351F5300
MSRPAIIVLSSFVVRGSVGARAAFALERLGHRVWTLPTVILPWHPGHGRAHRMALPETDFAALCADLARSPWLSEVGGIITGYLGSAGQADAAAALVAAVRAANPKALHLADPVIGDMGSAGTGSLYVPEPVAIAQRDRLVAIADIATPNRFELGWLTGLPIDTLSEIAVAARALGPKRVVVTSAPALMAGKIAAALVTANETIIAENQLIEGAPNGTGDLFAALFLSRLIGGASDEAALAAASASTFEVIARSVKAGARELELVDEQDALVHPMAMVDIRRLGTSRRGVARPSTIETL